MKRGALLLFLQSVQTHRQCTHNEVGGRTARNVTANQLNPHGQVAVVANRVDPHIPRLDGSLQHIGHHAGRVRIRHEKLQKKRRVLKRNERFLKRLVQKPSTIPTKF